MKDRVEKNSIEKDKIAALIEKHRPSTSNTPDEVNLSGIGTGTNSNGTEGPENVHPLLQEGNRA